MRAQLKHVLLDVNLPNHNKVKTLKRLFGAQGKCSLYEIYAAMSKATNAIVEKDLIIIIAEENDVTDPEGFFTYCLDRGLIQVESSGYSNQPVIDDQESLYKTQARWKKTREKQKDTPSPQRDSSDANARKSEYLNIELLNTDLDLILNGEFDTPLIRKALDSCRSKLRESKRDLNQQTLDALCMRKGSPELLLAALSHTATLTKAANVYDPPTSIITTNQTFKRQTNFERNIEVLKESLRDE